MASINSNASSAGPNEVKPREAHLWEKLGRLLHIPPLSRGDDPVYLSALDDTTLAQYGYTENQIQLMKEGTLR